MKFYKINMEYRKVQNGYLFDNGIIMNETAFKIWIICNEGISDEEIIRKFYEEYKPTNNTDKLTIKNDINICLEDLIEGELIKSK